jgi:hypothetical protein
MPFAGKFGWAIIVNLQNAVNNVLWPRSSRLNKRLNESVQCGSNAIQRLAQDKFLTADQAEQLGEQEANEGGEMQTR